MAAHELFDIVETVELDPFNFVVLPETARKACWCKFSPANERPTTPCPVDLERRAEMLGRVAAVVRSLMETAEEGERVELLGWAAGDYVSWDLRDDTVTVRITGTSTTYGRYIHYESTDGHGEMVDETAFMSLEAKVSDWRPATDEERARFDSLYRPAPQNWY
ncbi:hypothetical protein ACIQF6_35935 [Kitasatospora sp. NPDC092948]|uniref:hypothetical protein n=1 Tax=Kitasatospora sp. NPDC092948 TaxID=3364088 RepID=UPI00381C667F